MKRFSLIILTCFFSQLYFGQSDNCGGATALAIGASCTTTSFTNNENGQPETGAPIASCQTGTASSDVWFKVTPGSNQNIQITLSGSNRNASLAIYASCGGAEMGCLMVGAGASGSLIFAGTSGTTYFIQIMRCSGGASKDMDGDICAQSVSSAAPANDNPCAATVLPAGSSCTVTNTTNLNATNTAGVTAPGCSSYLGGDVWYSVVVPASGSLNIETQANSISDAGMALYTGTCGSLSLLSCDDDSGAGLMPSIAASGLTPGSTLFIRVWEYGNNANGTFGICATAGTAAAGNQNCASGTQICSDASFGGNSNGFASQELNATNQGCLSSEHQSSWYYFSPTSTGTISMDIKPVSGVDYDFAIWGPYNSMTCPVNTAPLRCSFASGFSTSFESVQASPLDYSTGLHSTAHGNGLAVSTSDGGAGDDLDGWVSPITIAGANVGKYYIMLIDNFSSNSTAFNIDFTLTCGLNCTPLPVDFSDFTGMNVDNRFNKITWSTASEQDNDYFILERSSDGVNWSNIATIPGSGNSSTMQEYIYDDFGFQKEKVNYYQLKQYDLNGDFKPSKLIWINSDPTYLLKTVNQLGQEVDSNYKGFVFEVYSNGTTIKKIK